MANINKTTPAAPSSAYRNAIPQVSGRDVSLYVPRRPDLDFNGGLWGARFDSASTGQSFGLWCSTNYTATETAELMVCPIDAYVRSLRARISSAQITGRTVAIRLMRTAVETGLISVVPPAAPVGNYINDDEAVALRRGERFGLFLSAVGASAGAAAIRNVSGEFASLDNSSILGWSGEQQTVPASTVQYAFPCSNKKGATASEFEIKIGVACTVRNLFLNTQTSQPSTGTLVVTLWNNGAPTVLTLTVATSGPRGPYADLTNSVALAANDRITLEIDNNATGASAQILSITFSVLPDSATLPSIIPAHANTTLAGTVTQYYNLFNILVASPGNTDEIAYPFPRAGTIGNFKVQGGTAGNAGSQIVWELYKNGSATGYKKTLGGDVATAWFDADAGSAVHFDLNDLGWAQVSHTGAGTDPIYGACFSFTPDLVT